MQNHKDNRRDFLKKTISTSIGLAAAPALLNAENTQASKAKATAHAAVPEWRNKRDGMAYRMFGNTGMMVSEIVYGTALWKSERFVDLFRTGFEKGVNYIDTAPAYEKGQAEKLIGAYLKESGNRDNLFLSTKISFYDEFVLKISNDILKGLPAEKQEQVRKKAEQMIEDRGILKPGYHFNYWDAQTNKVYDTYRRYVVFREYGSLREWKSKIKARMHELVESSLTALQTDYLDVLHCPHGVAMPEMLEDENIPEVIEALKKKGTIRFSALSMHNDVAGNLEKAIELGHYDAAMIAYNIGNHASLERLILKAHKQGMGIVAMKVAKIINGQDIPQWRVDKLNAAIDRDDLSLHAKAYLWALQNPYISCCVSDMLEQHMVAENVSIAGQKVDIGIV